MNARPAKRCKRPAYPTRREVAADPALLERHVPEAWKRSARLAAAAAMLAGAGTVALTPGCASGPPAKAAPIFDHGTGRGALPSTGQYQNRTSTALLAPTLCRGG